VYRGRPIALDLSACASCGLGVHAAALLEVLLPDIGT
jgi:hypothetical protein